VLILVNTPLTRKIEEEDEEDRSAFSIRLKLNFNGKSIEEERDKNLVLLCQLIYIL
jgi:hypothetical protein